jgi:hypothetical protein
MMVFGFLCGSVVALSYRVHELVAKPGQHSHRPRHPLDIRLSACLIHLYHMHLDPKVLRRLPKRSMSRRRDNPGKCQ